MKITGIPANILPMRTSVALEKTEPLPRPASTSVRLSEEGRDLAAHSNETRASYQRIYGTPTLDDRVNIEYDRVGHENYVKRHLPENYSAERSELFYKSVQYMVDVADGKYPKNNPFAGLGRDTLVAIQEDEGNFTEMERAAAGRAKYELDQAYFGRIFAYTDSTRDLRVLFRGYLEYLDNLTPVERLAYPDNEHELVAERLAHAQKETGSLPEDFSLWKYVNWDPKGRLNLEALLDPSKTEPAAALEAGPAADHGSSRLR